ncbi:MAG: RIP metalloprotease RseP [Candidatus Azambacteria bacterium]|nr:RIP metalloprotease RseP [Candidatus Azambacteria bacterium]
MLLTIIIFAAILGVLVLTHEWGHFIVARRAGLIVEEFGFGFPPRLFSFKRGETLYSINLLPLGGFVKIMGEDGSGIDNPRSFASKTVGVRSLITVAGVAMNFILGTILLIIGLYIGLPQAIDEENAALAKNIQIQIVLVAPNSPADAAGINFGDTVKYLKVGDKITNINEIATLQDAVNEYMGKNITLGVERVGAPIEFKMVPRDNPPEGEGALGIALAKTGIIAYSWYESLWLGTKSALATTWMIITGFFGIFKNLIFNGVVPKEVSGPVGIAVLAGQAASLGFIYLLQLMALISLNLAVLNLLPIPALDGGRLLFFAIEKIKGSKVNPKIENAIHAVGLFLLLALVILITYRDILSLK